MSGFQLEVGMRSCARCCRRRRRRRSSVTSAFSSTFAIRSNSMHAPSPRIDRRELLDRDVGADELDAGVAFVPGRQRARRRRARPSTRTADRRTTGRSRGRAATVAAVGRADLRDARRRARTSEDARRHDDLARRRRRARARCPPLACVLPIRFSIARRVVELVAERDPEADRSGRGRRRRRRTPGREVCVVGTSCRRRRCSRVCRCRGRRRSCA